MKKLSIILAILTTLFLVSCSQGKTGPDNDHASHDHSAQMSAQTICPIEGGKIDKSVYTDYKGHRVYYCCKGCDKDFMKDPERHLKAMASKGITTAKLQSTCPVSGDLLENKDVFANTEKGKIYVCCKKCKSKVEKAPDEYIKKLQKHNIVVGTYYQQVGNGSSDHSKHKH